VISPRRIVGLVAVVALVAVAGASASRQLSDRPLSAMSARELHARRASPAHVAAFFHRHSWLLAPRHATCWSHVPWSRSCNEARLAAHAARLQLAAIDRHLALLEARRLAALRARALSAWPAHHSLWLCIHGHEAADWQNADTGGNGHFGGLQMHPGWGYGTSYLASSDSQLVQERAAENGYAASGWSRAWLMGQWYHPDCLAYA
jgi:hypothetical protein